MIPQCKVFSLGNANGSKRSAIEASKLASSTTGSRTNEPDQAASNVIDTDGNINNTFQSDLSLFVLEHSEQTASSFPCKRASSDVELKSPAPKRSMISFARMEELRMENNRLKNQVEKYKKEWMRL